jgi:hypothetical protein
MASVTNWRIHSAAGRKPEPRAKLARASARVTHRLPILRTPANRGH